MSSLESTQPASKFLKTLLQCTKCGKICLNMYTMQCMHNYCNVCTDELLNSYSPNEIIKCSICDYESTMNQVEFVRDLLGFYQERYESSPNQAGSNRAQSSPSRQGASADEMLKDLPVDAKMTKAGYCFVHSERVAEFCCLTCQFTLLCRECWENNARERRAHNVIPTDDAKKIMLDEINHFYKKSQVDLKENIQVYESQIQNHKHLIDKNKTKRKKYDAKINELKGKLDEISKSSQNGDHGEKETAQLLHEQVKRLENKRLEFKFMETTSVLASKIVAIRSKLESQPKKHGQIRDVFVACYHVMRHSSYPIDFGTTSIDTELKLRYDTLHGFPSGEIPPETTAYKAKPPSKFNELKNHSLLRISDVKVESAVKPNFCIVDGKIVLFKSSENSVFLHSLEGLREEEKPVSTGKVQLMKATNSDIISVIENRLYVLRGTDFELKVYITNGVFDDIFVHADGATFSVLQTDYPAVVTFTKSSFNDDHGSNSNWIENDHGSNSSWIENDHGSNSNWIEKGRCPLTHPDFSLDKTYKANLVVTSDDVYLISKQKIIWGFSEKNRLLFKHELSWYPRLFDIDLQGTLLVGGCAEITSRLGELGGYKLYVIDDLSRVKEDDYLKSVELARLSKYIFDCCFESLDSIWTLEDKEKGHPHLRQYMGVKTDPVKVVGAERTNLDFSSLE